jgi:S-formylglutathione hydrolase FrmB
MALVRCDFFSDVLGFSTSMTVILPQTTTGQIGMTGRAGRAGGGDGFPTLYLLHGLSDDDTTWLRRTSIERYVAELGLAVVMPAAHRSFYCDEYYGRPYWTFLSEELPRVAGGFFRLSDRREDTFVAGLSMGGYGAFKWALRRPDRFAAAASLSGALDVAARLYQPPRSEDPLMWDRILGGRPLADTPDDLFYLLATVEQPPPLYLCCGTDDVVYDDNVRFADACRQGGVPLETQLGPGAHEWAYWDAKIQDVLAWLPLRTS